MFYKSGVKTIPSGVAGHFSKQNWADSIELHDGQSIYVKKSSVLLKMVDKLSDAQWDKIITSAVENAKAVKAAPEDLEVFGKASSDFELEDADYDADNTDSDCDDTEGEDDAFANMEEQDPYRWGFAGSNDEEVDELEDD